MVGGTKALRFAIVPTLPTIGCGLKATVAAPYPCDTSPNSGRFGHYQSITAENTPITFKRASRAMPRRWAVLHGSQADESESLPRRRGRGWQDLSHPPIRARELRRQVHPDARDQGLQEGAHLVVAGRVGGAQDRHDNLGHHGPERLPRAAKGSVFLRRARDPRGL